MNKKKWYSNKWIWLIAIIIILVIGFMPIHKKNNTTASTETSTKTINIYQKNVKLVTSGSNGFGKISVRINGVNSGEGFELSDKKYTNGDTLTISKKQMENKLGSRSDLFNFKQNKYTFTVQGLEDIAPVNVSNLDAIIADSKLTSFSKKITAGSNSLVGDVVGVYFTSTIGKDDLKRYKYTDQGTLHIFTKNSDSNDSKLSDYTFTSASITNNTLTSSNGDQQLSLDGYPVSYDSKFTTPLECLKSTNQYNGKVIFELQQQ